MQVSSVITRKIYSQVFSFINVQLFNRYIILKLKSCMIWPDFFTRSKMLMPNVPWFYSLLLRRECCSFSNGEYVKAGLQEFEQWCMKAADQVRLQLKKNYISINYSRDVKLWRDDYQETLLEFTSCWCSRNILSFLLSSLF